MEKRSVVEFLRRRYASAIRSGDDRTALRLRLQLDRVLNGRLAQAPSYRPGEVLTFAAGIARDGRSAARRQGETCQDSKASDLVGRVAHVVPAPEPDARRRTDPSLLATIWLAAGSDPGGAEGGMIAAAGGDVPVSAPDRTRSAGP
jgi:hypothetical protein